MEKKMKTGAPTEYLKRPYVRMLTPDAGGGYVAEILEFEGCFAEGPTSGQALKRLESVAEVWIEDRLEAGLHIPEPTGHMEMSGKFALRLPQNLHTKAAIMAEREGVSLNTFFVSAIAASVGAKELFGSMLEQWQEMMRPFNYHFESTRAYWQLPQEVLTEGTDNAAPVRVTISRSTLEVSSG